MPPLSGFISVISGIGGVEEEFVIDERLAGSAGIAGLQACMTAGSDGLGLDSSSAAEPHGHARLGNIGAFDGSAGLLVVDEVEEEVDVPAVTGITNGAAKAEPWIEGVVGEDVDADNDVDVASGKTTVMPLELLEDGTAPLMTNEGRGTSGGIPDPGVVTARPVVLFCGLSEATGGEVDSRGC